METVERDINIVTTSLSDADKPKRRMALQRLLKVVQAAQAKATTAGGDRAGDADAPAPTPEQLMNIARACCRALEDRSELCREHAIAALDILITMLPPAVLDYVLPSVVSRIGIEKAVAEDSEVLRLQLHNLAVSCLTTFPNDITRCGFLEFYTVLLTNCLKDPFPELKKSACAACVTLCRVEPTRVKHATLPLAKAVKTLCLQHKHSTVRVEAVRALGTLIKHGAAEILGDMKDEQDNRTTVYYLYILCSDQSEPVRVAMVHTLGIILGEITERYEQYRRLLPHLLLLLSDPVEEVRLPANSLMLDLGTRHARENEDNSIDITKRRVNMKDIEWYADDEYPDLAHFETPCPFDHLGWTNRPILGARHLVAEHTRTFLETVLKDVTVLDWMIPFSAVNKRIAALRIVCMTAWYIEQDVVQYTPAVLATLYKVLQDENPDIAAHAHFTVELIGKFLTADQFLPILISKAPSEGEETLSKTSALAAEDSGDVQSERRRNTLVTKTSINADADNAPPVVPTLFATAANTTKTSILIAFRYFVLGCKRTLTQQQAEVIVASLCRLDVSDVDSPRLLSALVAAVLAAGEVLVCRGLVCTPSNPMPPEVQNNVKIQTFDSKLLYALLCIRSSEDKSVVRSADAAIATLSQLTTGTPTGMIDLHFGRLLFKKAAVVPVAAFEALLNGARHIGAFSDPLVALFVHRLATVNYALRVTSELHFFALLQQLLDSGRISFAAAQLDTLLRSIVLVHGGFHPGPTAALFRKIAMSSLRVILTRYRAVLTPLLVESQGQLTEKIVAVWLAAVDGDDAALRQSCVESIADLCQLPLAEGQASDILDHIMLRLDDSVDALRVEVVRQLSRGIQSGLAPAVKEALRSKIVPTTKTLLTHMNDHVERVGLKGELQQLLVLIGQTSNKDIVLQLTYQAKPVHAKTGNTAYCDAVIAALE